jgi:hypothetical protein
MYEFHEVGFPLEQLQAFLYVYLDGIITKMVGIFLTITLLSLSPKVSVMDCSLHWLLTNQLLKELDCFEVTHYKQILLDIYKSL